MDKEATPVFADFDELRKTVAMERNSSPPELMEEPKYAQTSFVLPPTLVPRKHADQVKFISELTNQFFLKFDDSEISEIYRNSERQLSPQEVIGILLERDNPLRFKYGMLHFTTPDRITPIISLQLSHEAVTAAVVGSTTEAAWVAQKGLELLWAATGASRSWAELINHVQVVGYQTTTRVNLGVNLVTMFSESFRSFVREKIEGKNSLGTMMGRRPYHSLFRESEKDRVSAVAHVYNVQMRVSLFDDLTGRSEDCDIQLEVPARSETGHGFITITSELDSPNHTKLLKQLRDAVVVEA